jgi:hypothetical protein
MYKYLNEEEIKTSLKDLYVTHLLKMFWSELSAQEDGKTEAFCLKARNIAALINNNCINPMIDLLRYYDIDADKIGKEVLEYVKSKEKN